MGENQGGEEEKTPRGKKRKREGDPEVIKTITTFIDDKFKNVLKEAVLKDDSDLTDPIIQIGVKMYITDLLSKSKGALATGVCKTRTRAWQGNSEKLRTCCKLLKQRNRVQNPR